MTKRALPMIVADEHMEPAIIESIDEVGGFKVIRANSDRRFRGRDEWAYLPELRSLNFIFLTCDGSFVRRVVDHGARHAGIVWLPQRWPVGEKAAAICFACGAVQWHFDHGGVHGMRDVVIRIEHDGLRTIEDGREQLALSLPALEFAVDEYISTGQLG